MDLQVLLQAVKAQYAEAIASEEPLVLLVLELARREMAREK